MKRKIHISPEAEYKTFKFNENLNENVNLSVPISHILISNFYQI